MQLIASHIRFIQQAGQCFWMTSRLLKIEKLKFATYLGSLHAELVRRWMSLTMGASLRATECH